jgi:hypothetical protein
MPDFILKKYITSGAKILYALLCNHAAKLDHCWPSHATLAGELACSVSSVKRYLSELVAEKLVVVRQEQYRSSVYYMIRPDGLKDREVDSARQQPNEDHHQPNENRPRSNLSYLNNLKKQEENTNSPLPPAQAQKPSTSSSGTGRVGGGGAFFPDFAKAWEAYPKKEAQGFARSAWNNLFRAGLLPPLETILSAVGRFAATESWQRENGRYIPQMANFLRGQRWLDPLSPEEKQKAQEKEELQAAKRKLETAETAKKEKHNRLRPLFDAFADTFSARKEPYNDSMAYGTWRYLHSKGQAPFASDVPDGNALDIMAFMKAFQRTCEGNARRMEHPGRELQPSNGNFHASTDNFQGETRGSRARTAASCGEILRANGLLSRLGPQREVLCAAV